MNVGCKLRFKAIQPVAESTSGTSVVVPPPAKSESPDVDAGAESSMTSSFTNMPSSFSHPPPPLSSGPPQPTAPPSTVQAAVSNCHVLVPAEPSR